jgi:hypothetical protein
VTKPESLDLLLLGNNSISSQIQALVIQSSKLWDSSAFLGTFAGSEIKQPVLAADPVTPEVDLVLIVRLPLAHTTSPHPLGISRLLKNWLRCHHGVKNRLKMLLHHA